MQATLVVFLAGGDIVLLVSPLPCDMALTLPAGESLCSELEECHMVHGLPPLLLCDLPFDMVLTLSAGESLCSEVEECHMTLSEEVQDDSCLGTFAEALFARGIICRGSVE